MLTALLLSSALADQTTFNIDKGGGEWDFTVAWTDARDKKHRAAFSLPAEEVKADLEEPLRFKPKEARKAMVKAVNQWGKQKKGPKVTAKLNSSGGVTYEVTGKDREKREKALAQAHEVGDKALEKYLKRNGFTRNSEGTIIPDWAGHVNAYSDDLMPVVRALGGPTRDPQVFGNKALSFVQSIPYEKASLRRDRYRRPLSLLGRNRGDCDSKVVLYLSLMKAAYPKLDSGIVQIKGHAYGALDTSGEGRTIKVGKERWLVVEPVGPAVVPMGVLGKRSKRKSRMGRYEVLET